MRRDRTQTKAEVAQGLERAYAGLLYDLDQEDRRIETAERLLQSLPTDIQSYHERRADIAAQMEALAISIRRFNAQWAETTVVPKQIKRALSPFDRGEVGRHGIGLLRQTGQVLSADDVLSDLCRERGVEDTKELRWRLRQSVEQAMKIAEARGVVVQVLSKPKRWKFVKKEEWAGPEPTVDYDFDEPPPRAASAASSP
jgi:hypothetical protein